MSTQPDDRHLSAVPDSHQLAAEQATAAAEEIARLEEIVTTAHAIELHKEQAEKHKTRVSELEHYLRQLHAKQGSTVKAGDLAITWKTPNRSFNGPKFIETYPASKHPHLYTTKTILDPDAIPPKLKAKFMEPGTGEGSLIIK